MRVEIEMAAGGQSKNSLEKLAAGTLCWSGRRTWTWKEIVAQAMMDRSPS